MRLPMSPLDVLGRLALAGSLTGWLAGAQILLRLSIAPTPESREYISVEIEVFQMSTQFAAFGNDFQDLFFGVNMVPQGFILKL